MRYVTVTSRPLTVDRPHGDGGVPGGLAHHRGGDVELRPAVVVEDGDRDLRRPRELRAAQIDDRETGVFVGLVHPVAVHHDRHRCIRLAGRDLLHCEEGRGSRGTKPIPLSNTNRHGYRRGPVQVDAERRGRAAVAFDHRGTVDDQRRIVGVRGEGDRCGRGERRLIQWMRSRNTGRGWAQSRIGRGSGGLASASKYRRTSSAATNVPAASTWCGGIGHSWSRDGGVTVGSEAPSAYGHRRGDVGDRSSVTP